MRIDFSKSEGSEHVRPRLEVMRRCLGVGSRGSAWFSGVADATHGFRWQIPWAKSRTAFEAPLRGATWGLRTFTMLAFDLPMGEVLQVHLLNCVGKS